MECECKYLSIMENRKHCICNKCGKIWTHEDGKWEIVKKIVKFKNPFHRK